MVSRIDRYPLVGPDGSTAPEPPLRLLLLGTCALNPLRDGLEQAGCIAEHYITESYSNAEMPSVNYQSYDGVVVALTFRHISAEAAQILMSTEHPTTCIYWIRAVESGRVQEYFDACANLIARQVEQLCSLMPMARVFFLSIIEPMHNYLGNLLPRNDLSNPVYFVRKLNEVLEEALRRFPSAYFMDINELICLLGRARIQDDYISQLSHASFLGNDPWDADRLQPSIPPLEMYESLSQLRSLGSIFSRRLRDDLSILKNLQQIKAIILDLDDTLWRGVAADEDRPLHEFTEGWPLGLAEALLIYKMRGGLLALCSRNERADTERRFDRIFNQRLMLADFVSTRINHQPKSENIRSILADLNILPENALYIDDNPREVDEVKVVFPNMLVYSADHYDWRRKILLSPETQVPYISDESRQRTVTIRSKIERDHSASSMPRASWLTSLNIVQRYELVSTVDDHHFKRAFELINKTNQFNTTGRRWEVLDLQSLFDSRGYLVCSFLKDRTVDNGLVGVAIVRESWILQVVLSCRVFNLQSEQASAHMICQLILDVHGEVWANAVETGKNFSCRNYYSSLGFERRGESFYTNKLPDHPPHVTSEWGNRKKAGTPSVSR